MKWSTQALWACLLVGAALVSCAPGSGRLPQGGKDALANVVAEAEGSQFQYSLVSVQKATLTSTDLEADELWCVVIDQQVTMPWLWTEITSNRFVAFKDGDVWDALPAEALWGKDLEEVPPGPGAIGCKSFIASGE